MARIRQYADKYATADLVGELNAQMCRKKITQAELAKMLNISQPSVSKYLNHPGEMPVRVFRGMVAALSPNPAICMRFLQFSKSAIKGEIE